MLWLAGYESILKCMTPGNFNLFMHVMLYYHTKHVLRKQNMKKEKEDKEIQDDDSNDEIEYADLEE